MYRVRLTDAQREEFQRRTHAPDVKPRTRDRLEMLRLAAAGWSIPRIAVHFQRSEKCVRYWIKTFLTEGFDALPDRPHPGQQSALTPEMEAALRQELLQGQRTWTAAQLADWVAERFGVRLTPDHLARRLKRARISYKRTGRSLKHKQKPEEVATKKAEREGHEKRGPPARSMSWTWTKRGLPPRCRPTIAGIRGESACASRMKPRKVAASMRSGLTFPVAC